MAVHVRKSIILIFLMLSQNLSAEDIEIDPPPVLVQPKEGKWEPRGKRGRSAENSGPVLHLTFDKNGRQYEDSSSGGFHAVSRGARFVPDGKNGGSVYLDGKNDRLRIPNIKCLENTWTLTVAAWVKLESFGPGGYGNEHGYIVSKGNCLWWNPAFYLGYVKKSGSGKARWPGDPGPNEALFHVCSSAGRQNGGGKTVKSRTKLHKGRWYHLAGVYDGRSVKIYVNGKHEGSATYTGPLRSDGAPVNIGGGNLSGVEWGSHFVFNGTVDDVMIWDRALNASEIKSLSGMVAVGIPNIQRFRDLDMIKMVEGSLVRGTIENSDWDVTTFYGDVKIPADRVIGMVPAGDKKRVRILLTDGQLVSGVPKWDRLKIRTEAGMTISAPPIDIVQCSYRISDKKPSGTTLFGLSVQLTTGDVITLKEIPREIGINTDFGEVTLAGKAVQTVQRIASRHRIKLVNGSLISGTLSGNKIVLQTKFRGDIEVDAGLVMMLSQAAKVGRLRGVVIKLRNRDLLVGTFPDDTLPVRTRFGRLTPKISGMRRIEFKKDKPGFVKLTAANGTVIEGKLEVETLGFSISMNGPRVTVPVDKIDSIEVPLAGK